MFKIIMLPILRNGFFIMAKESYEDWKKHSELSINIVVTQYKLKVHETKNYFIFEPKPGVKYDEKEIKNSFIK